MRVKTMLMLVAPFAAALSVAPAPAHALRQSGPCRQELEKLCPNVKPGGGALRDCIKQHAAELSPECQEHMKQRKAQLDMWRQACQDDVQKLCADAQPGRGGIAKCLRQHHDQLSQACQDQIAEHRRHGRHPKSQPAAPSNESGGS